MPGPRGRTWADTTIRDHHKRGTGILRNELYIGRLVWNRQRFLKDPETGKRIARMNPPERWVIEEVPDLQIIDQELWDRAHARLTSGIAPVSPRFGRAGSGKSAGQDIS